MFDSSTSAAVNFSSKSLSSKFMPREDKADFKSALESLVDVRLEKMERYSCSACMSYERRTMHGGDEVVEEKFGGGLEMVVVERVDGEEASPRKKTFSNKI